jgi:geranylgeranyl pyrophosphate synthase
VRAGDAPQRALDRARELASRARAQLEKLPDGPASQALASLTEYVVSRKS